MSIQFIYDYLWATMTKNKLKQKMQMNVKYVWNDCDLVGSLLIFLMRQKTIKAKQNLCSTFSSWVTCPVGSCVNTFISKYVKIQMVSFKPMATEKFEKMLSSSQVKATNALFFSTQKLWLVSIHKVQMSKSIF